MEGGWRGVGGGLEGDWRGVGGGLEGGWRGVGGGLEGGWRGVGGGLEGGWRGIGGGEGNMIMVLTRTPFCGVLKEFVFFAKTVLGKGPANTPFFFLRAFLLEDLCIAPFPEW